MFLVVNYDVAKPRGLKVMKYLKPYLHHIQESVFVGKVSDGTYKELKKGLEKVIDKDNDRIIMYQIETIKAMKVELIGKQVWIENII